MPVAARSCVYLREAFVSGVEQPVRGRRRVRTEPPAPGLGRLPLLNRGGRQEHCGPRWLGRLRGFAVTQSQQTLPVASLTPRGVPTTVSLHDDP